MPQPGPNFYRGFFLVRETAVTEGMDHKFRSGHWATRVMDGIKLASSVAFRTRECTVFRGSFLGIDPTTTFKNLCDLFESPNQVVPRAAQSRFFSLRNDENVKTFIKLVRVLKSKAWRSRRNRFFVNYLSSCLKYHLNFRNPSVKRVPRVNFNYMLSTTPYFWEN